MTVHTKSGQPVFLPNGNTALLEGGDSGTIVSVTHTVRAGEYEQLLAQFGRVQAANVIDSKAAGVMVITLDDGKVFSIRDVTYAQFGGFKAKYGL